VSYQFCDNTRIPLWFAYKDGAGAWIRVLADANNKFNFNINSDNGAVAYVLSSGGSTETEVYYMTRAELQAQATSECLQSPPAGKTVNGTVQGLGEEELATVVFGGDFAFVIGNTGFTMNNVWQGAQDLLAVRMNDAGTPNKLVLLRNQNIANNGNLPAINFEDAVNSFVPATANVTYANNGGQLVALNHFWYSPTGAFAPYAFDFLGSTSNATFYGIPTARLATGELHVLVATTDFEEDATEGRAVYSMFRTVANKTITFGATLTAPTYTSSTSGGVALPRAQGPIQGDYDDLFTVTFDQASLNRSVTINATRGYFGANPTTYDLQTPNLVGLSGFNTAWGLVPGTPIDAVLTAIGANTGAVNVFADGTTWTVAFRRATFTP
jgi:hypothetical protein